MDPARFDCERNPERRTVRPIAMVPSIPFLKGFHRSIERPPGRCGQPGTQRKSILCPALLDRSAAFAASPHRLRQVHPCCRYRRLPARLKHRRRIDSLRSGKGSNCCPTCLVLSESGAMPSSFYRRFETSGNCVSFGLLPPSRVSVPQSPSWHTG